MRGLAGCPYFLSNRAFLHELFNEHRLADVLVHGGGCAMSPGRLDHWISLAEHLRRYANVRPQPTASKKTKRKQNEEDDCKGESEDSKGGSAAAAADAMARGWEFFLWWWTYVMERRFSVGGRSGGMLSVADVVDIAAHFKTATRVLNPLEVIAATAAAEAARRCLRLDLVRHHRHGWSDVRRLVMNKKRSER